jgi:hypothetical protein
MPTKPVNSSIGYRINGRPMTIGEAHPRRSIEVVVEFAAPEGFKIAAAVARHQEKAALILDFSIRIGLPPTAVVFTRKRLSPQLPFS